VSLERARRRVVGVVGVVGVARARGGRHDASARSRVRGV
jgi:hypothetical protein